MPKLCSNLPRPTAEPYSGMAIFIFGFNNLILPQLVQHRVCRNSYNSTTCSSLGKDGFQSIQNGVQAEAARWMALLPLSALIPAIFMVLIIGPISDVIGKKRIMVLPPLIYLIQSIIFIILCSLKSSFSPAFYFFPYCLTGIFGDSAGVVLLAASYMADITKPEERTRRFTVLESSSFVGVLAAAVGSGLALSKFGFIGAFSTTAIVSLLNLLYTVFVLPSEDSVRLSDHVKITANQDYGSGCSNNQTDASQASHQRSPSQSRKELVSLLRKATNLKNCFFRLKNALCMNGVGQIIAALLVLLAIALFVNMGEIYMGVLFLKHSPFNLKPLQIGYFAAVSYTLRALGVVIIPYICQRLFKMKDTGLLIFGFTAQVVYFLVLSFSVNVPMLFSSQIISMGIVIHMPVFRSMLSKLVNADQHGSVLAAAEAIDIASSLTTSFLSNIIYSETVKLFPGFAFCILSIMGLVGLIGAIAFCCKFPRPYRDEFSDLREEQSVLLYENKSLNPECEEMVD